MPAKKRTNPLVRTTDATKAKLPKPRKPKAAPAVPCMDWPADSLPSGTIPPDTEPYPWPVRLFYWLDDRYEDARWWLATRLQRLAKWVSPLVLALALSACTETHELIVDGTTRWHAQVGPVEYDPSVRADMVMGDVFSDYGTGRHVIRLPNDGLTCWHVSLDYPVPRTATLRTTHRVRRGILGTDTKSDVILDYPRHQATSIAGCTDHYTPSR